MNLLPVGPDMSMLDPSGDDLLPMGAEMTMLDAGLGGGEFEIPAGDGFDVGSLYVFFVSLAGEFYFG
jgi:hypothetical protein